MEALPALDYLELSSVQLPEELIHKCTEKFRQVVIYGAPDLPHNKRQHLLGSYTIGVTILFARDFPINLRPQFEPEQAPVFSNQFANSAIKNSRSGLDGAASESGHVHGLRKEDLGRVLASS